MRKLRTPMLILALLSSLCAIATSAGLLYYWLHPIFGAAPESERLARITASPNYVDGAFRNQIETPMLTTDESRLSLMWRNFSGKRQETRPPRPLPTIKTDLRMLDPAQDLVIWLGHSSYYVQLGGRRILIDPIFNDHAAPLPWVNRSFAGTDLYTAADLPDIDLLIITHDHYDHLDYKTVRALGPKVSTIVTALGVGAHLEAWGYPDYKINELDWGEVFRVSSKNDDDTAKDSGISTGKAALEIIATPGRHFSGRTFKRSQTLWMGLVLRTVERRLFFSGDTGYGPHFSQIGAHYGPFDWVTLDTGQYNPRWAFMHMQPEEAAQAAEDLCARAYTPGHVGRLTISDHDWDDPFKRISVASVGRSYALWTPEIGRPIYLDGRPQHFRPWWESVSQDAPAAGSEPRSGNDYSRLTRCTYLVTSSSPHAYGSVSLAPAYDLNPSRTTLCQ